MSIARGVWCRVVAFTGLIAWVSSYLVSGEVRNWVGGSQTMSVVVKQQCSRSDELTSPGMTEELHADLQEGG